MHIRVADTVGAYLQEIDAPIVYVDDIQCVLVKLLIPTIIHLFVVGFCGRSPIVPGFPLERKSRYHSNKPHFNFDPCNYGHIGYLGWKGSLEVVKQSVTRKQPIQHDQETTQGFSLAL